MPQELTPSEIVAKIQWLAKRFPEHKITVPLGWNVNIEKFRELLKDVDFECIIHEVHSGSPSPSYGADDFDNYVTVNNAAKKILKCNGFILNTTKIFNVETTNRTSIFPFEYTHSIPYSDELQREVLDNLFAGCDCKLVKEPLNTSW